MSRRAATRGAYGGEPAAGPRGRSLRRARLALSLGALVCTAAPAVADSPSTDATLSGLRMEDADGVKVTQSPVFSATTTSYTSNARAVVDRITVEGTPSDANATLAFLDGEDAELADIDAVTEGVQVALAVGENTITWQVTAEDGVTTLAYTVVVTRAVPMASPDALISNLDEPNVASIIVGSPPAVPNLQGVNAIGFETGGSEDGYTLASVKTLLRNASPRDGVRVRIFDSRANGKPRRSLVTLVNPASFAWGLNTFDAPANTRLEKDKRYFVVFDITEPAPDYYKMRGTRSDSVNSRGGRLAARHRPALHGGGFGRLGNDRPRVDRRDQRRSLRSLRRRHPGGSRPDMGRRRHRDRHRARPGIRRGDERVHGERGEQRGPDDGRGDEERRRRHCGVL